MKIRRIDPEAVQTSERLRSIDWHKVEELADSMEVIGLQQPITVHEDGGTFRLVAGLHRREAAIKLGWNRIDAVVTDLNEIDRGLWEVDENLRRAELSPADRDRHLARRKELWQARKEAEAQAEDDTLVENIEEKSGETFATFEKRGRGETGFASDTAKETGQSKSSINKALQRAKAIPDDVYEMIGGTFLDKQSYLQKLAKLPPEEQREKVTSDLESPPKPRKKPAAAADERDDKKWLTILMDAWQRASPEERQDFLRWAELEPRAADEAAA